MPEEVVSRFTDDLQRRPKRRASVKSQMRSLKRLLSKESLSAEARAHLESRQHDLEGELETRKDSEVDQRNLQQSRRLRHEDRCVVERHLQAFPNSELWLRRQMYIDFFPPSEHYVPLFPRKPIPCNDSKRQPFLFSLTRRLAEYAHSLPPFHCYLPQTMDHRARCAKEALQSLETLKQKDSRGSANASDGCDDEEKKESSANSDADGGPVPKVPPGLRHSGQLPKSKKRKVAMLYLIGLGLGTEKDVTVRGLEAIRSCSRVFLESYTSLLCVEQERLEGFYGCHLEQADRTLVESESDQILRDAKESNVAFLVVGDPFGATTHTDLYLRARSEGIAVEVIHNASILNAVGCCGLQLYRFGQTISVPFYTDTWKPDGFYLSLAQNLQHDLHTLCLLDIKVKEPDFQAMVKGITRFEPPRFMTVNQCLEQLQHCEGVHRKARRPAATPQSRTVITDDTLVVGLARVGQADQIVRFGPLKDVVRFDFGAPLHCVIVPASLHELELQMLDLFRIA